MHHDRIESCREVVGLGSVPTERAPIDKPFGRRTTYCTDPDGNVIEIGSLLKKR